MTHVNIPALMHSARPVVEITDGQAITTSVEIARVFEKRHTHVLDSIKTLAQQLPESNQPNFRLVDYTDDKGERRPAYHLTRDGFTLLAMRFTGKKALAFQVAYIDAFNRMEAELTGHHIADASKMVHAYHNASIEQAYALAQQTAAIVADKIYRAALTGQPVNAERWLFMVSGHASKVTPVDPRAFVLTPAQIVEGIQTGELPFNFSEIELTQLAQAIMERVKIRLGKPPAYHHSRRAVALQTQPGARP